MTEDEARTKWCPFARQMVSIEQGYGGRPLQLASANRFKENEMTACIASECMAWRWNHEGYEKALEAYEDSLAIAGIDRRDEPVLGGYCGLAGAA